MVVVKHLIFQKVIVSYLKDADTDIMFTMKGIEMKFYGMRLHLLTRFEQSILRKTEVTADGTI